MNVVQCLDESWDSGLTAYGLQLSRALLSAGQASRVVASRGSYAASWCRDRGVPCAEIGSREARAWIRDADVCNAHTGRTHLRAVFLSKGAVVRTRADARAPRRTFAQNWVLRRTHAVIAASDFVARGLAGAFPELDGRLRVVYPAEDAAPYEDEPSGSLRVGLVGRLDPVKGHETALRAWALIRGALNGAELIIAGEEKNVSRSALRSLSERLGVAGSVRFEGRLADVKTFMRSCHIGLIASTGSEAVARAALEWMSSGRPLVATVVGCLPELVDSGLTGLLVPPKTPSSLAQALAELLRRREERSRMGRRAHESASRRFSTERMVSGTLAAYEAALRRKRDRA